MRRLISLLANHRLPLTKACRSRSEIDAEKLLILFRKLGAKFTVADRDLLFKQMDTAHRGAASFTEFAVAFSRVDTTKLGGLSELFKCVPLAVVLALSCADPRRRALQRGDTRVRDIIRADVVDRGA